ncbi:MAG: hypothetical protein NC206_05210 [Bacteroides sp.]|nr:hypothetical protein [Roseburia sp.]MCM1346464.1 hypothetical protein [Bacteroides sp.]MCM1420333.1 hypothetical protein [Bacteroides sp.]
MKKFKFLAYAFAALAIGGSFTACSDDDDDAIKGIPQVNDVHYDILVSVGGAAGMGSTSSNIIQSLNSLEKDSIIDFRGIGVDITAIMDAEAMIKGQYYYEAAPLGLARYGKYKVTNSGVETIAERPFGTNTYKDRRYTHDWLSDSEFFVMGSNGNSSEILWTKLKDEGDKLTIMAEGDLGLATNTDYLKILEDNDIVAGTFSTSGLARYRSNDNTIIYAFRNAKDTEGFYVAFIDATTMKIKSVVRDTRAQQMAGTAYGELLQHKMFLDEHGNLYIGCNSQIPNAEKSTCQYGRLLRIKNGAYEFDQTYEGYKDYTGKIVTCDYLGNNKALLYIQDPQHTGCSTDNAVSAGWGDNYNSYYAILDLNTDAKSEIEYEGKKLPYSSGTFSQRSFILNNKAFIGVNPKDSAPVVYIYDIKSGKTTKGITIKEGYTFNRIIYISNK